MHNDSDPSRAARPMRRIAVAIVATGAVMAAGCGGDDATGSSGPVAAVDEGGSPLTAEATGSLPLTVVADGSEVALGEVAASDRPTLLWFWAPH